MEQKKKLSLKAFFKRILPYSLILFLTIFVVSLFFYFQYTDIAESRLYDTYYNDLVQRIGIFEAQLKDINYIAGSMEQNSLFSEQNLTKDYFQLYLAQKELIKILKYNTFIDEIYLYIFPLDMLISSSTSIRSEFFINAKFDLDELISNDSIKEGFYRNENWLFGKKTNLIIQHLPSHSIEPYAIIFFELTDNTLSNIFPNLNLGDQFYIFNQKDSLIFSSPYNTQKYESLNFDTIQDGSSFFLEFTSDLTGYNYKLVKSYSLISNDFELVLLGGLFLVSSVYIIGILLIVVSTWLNYKPINNLITLLCNSSNDDIPYKKNTIAHALDLANIMIQTDKTLKTQVEDYSKSARYVLFDHLLNNQFSNIDEFNKRASSLQISFAITPIRIAFFKCQVAKELSDENISKIANIIEAHKGWYLHITYQSSIVIFFIETERRSRNDILKQVLNILKQEDYTSSYKIGISKSVSDLSLTGNAYMEAMTASDIDTEEEIVEFNTKMYSSSHMKAFNQNFSLLKLAISNLRIEEIQDITNQICIKIGDEKLTLVQAKRICLLFIDCFQDESIEKVFTQSIDWQKFHYLCLSPYLKICDVKTIINDVASEFCSKINKEENKNKKISDIFDYITKHAFNQNFTVKDVATYFDMSDSNLSHMFKSQTGNNIMDYITSIRIERAKYYLVQTDMPLKAIVTEVGWNDVSSFIKKFKQITGNTPGIYRQTHKNYYDTTACQAKF